MRPTVSWVFPQVGFSSYVYLNNHYFYYPQCVDQLVSSLTASKPWRILYVSKVKSAFKWCVDSELLRSNNLICPLDYTTVHTPVVKTPKGIISLTYKVKTYSNNQITCYNTVIFPFFAGTFTPGFAQPTVSYNMHICTEPQDDGYTPLPPPAHTSLLEQSEETLTLPSSPESCSMKDTEVCLWTLFHFPHIKGSRMTFIFFITSLPFKFTL